MKPRKIKILGEFGMVSICFGWQELLCHIATFLTLLPPGQ